VGSGSNVEASPYQISSGHLCRRRPQIRGDRGSSATESRFYISHVLCIFSNGLPAAFLRRALARIRQTLLQAQGALHLLVCELDGDAVLRRSSFYHPLPFQSAGTRDARSVFLNGHLQAKEDCCFILVEHSDNAPTVDHGNLSIEQIGHVAGLAINGPDAYRGDLVDKRLLYLLACKPLLCEVGPVGAAVRIGRWANVQPIYFQPRIEPPLIALVGISPSSKLRGCPRISLIGPVRDPRAEILRKCSLPPLLNSVFQCVNFKDGFRRSLREQNLLVRP
jgi:hypothetical protein